MSTSEEFVRNVLGKLASRFLNSATSLSSGDAETFCAQFNKNLKYINRKMCEIINSTPVSLEPAKRYNFAPKVQARLRASSFMKGYICFKSMNVWESIAMLIDYPVGRSEDIRLCMLHFLLSNYEHYNKEFADRYNNVVNSVIRCHDFRNRVMVMQIVSDMFQCSVIILKIGGPITLQEISHEKQRHGKPMIFADDVSGNGKIFPVFGRPDAVIDKAKMHVETTQRLDALSTDLTYPVPLESSDDDGIDRDHAELGPSLRTTSDRQGCRRASLAGRKIQKTVSKNKRAAYEGVTYMTTRSMKKTTGDDCYNIDDGVATKGVNEKYNDDGEYSDKLTDAYTDEDIDKHADEYRDERADDDRDQRTDEDRDERTDEDRDERTDEDRDERTDEDRDQRTDEDRDELTDEDRDQRTDEDRNERTDEDRDQRTDEDIEYNHDHNLEKIITRKKSNSSSVSKQQREKDVKSILSGRSSSQPISHRTRARTQRESVPRRTIVSGNATTLRGVPNKEKKSPLTQNNSSENESDVYEPEDNTETEDDDSGRENYTRNGSQNPSTQRKGTGRKKTKFVCGRFPIPELENICKCGRSLSSKQKLKDHIMRLLPQLEPCTRCGMTFKRKDILKFHIDEEHLGIRYVCPICPNYRASFRTDFVAHRKSFHPGTTVCGVRSREIDGVWVPV